MKSLRQDDPELSQSPIMSNKQEDDTVGADTPKCGSLSRLSLWLGAALSVCAIEALSPDHAPADFLRASILGALGILGLSFGLMRSQGLMRGVCIGLTLLGVLWLVDAPLADWEARAPWVTAFNYAAGPILSVCGYDPSLTEGWLHVDHHEGMVSIAPSFEKVGLRPLVLFAFMVLLITGLYGVRGWLRRVSLAIAVLGVLAGLRYGLLILFYLDQDRILVRTWPSPLAPFSDRNLLLTWMLVCGVGSFICVRFLPTRLPAPQTAASNRGLMLAVALAALMATLSYEAHDPGSPTEGRILVDDRCSDYWEPSARLLDTSWYGDFSTYNFNSAVEWLSHRYILDVNTRRKYDDSLLSSYDILIIKTPILDFDPNEVAAIHRFVESGGGLLLVGDHTNLLGMGTRLNQLLEPYPMSFRYDSVGSASSGGFSLFTGAMLGNHPAALRVEQFEFMTSCSLSISYPAQAVMRVPNSLRDPVDYANSSHFGGSIDDPSVERGPMVLAATSASGKGRVGAFTDSTVWSSFDFFKNDHEVLLLDMIEYLRRQNRWSPQAQHILGLLAFLIAIILGAVVVFRLRRVSLGLLIVATVGVLCGAAIARVATNAAYELPGPHIPEIRVNLQWDGSECAVPAVIGVQVQRLELAFDTLFVTLQRMGIRPALVLKMDDVFDNDPQALLIVNPLVAPSPHYLWKLRRWVEEGGSLVIIDREAAKFATAASHYLRYLDCDVQYSSTDPNELSIKGMEPVPIPARSDIALTRKVGQGSVVYLSDSEHYSRVGLGHAFAIPWSDARDRYATIFKIFGEHLDLKRENRRTYGVLE